MHDTIEPLPAGTLIRLLIDGQDTPCAHCWIELDPLPVTPPPLNAPWTPPGSLSYAITYTDPAGGEHHLPARWVTLIWESPCLTLDVFTQQEGN